MAARLPYLERDQVGAETQAIYDRLEQSRGRVLNIFRTLVRAPLPVPNADQGAQQCSTRGREMPYVVWSCRGDLRRSRALARQAVRPRGNSPARAGPSPRPNR